MNEEAILKRGSVSSRGVVFTPTLLALLFVIAGTVMGQEVGNPNAGSLQAVDSSGKAAGQCPLKHTTVKAEVSGFISRVTVTQDFQNPFTDKIEAIYTFPLPQSAAVDDMTMLIGDRTVKGKILRREEAQAAYAAAKQLGKIAALLDQERPNIFTQAVANILPGQQIRIVISYVETLKYEDGSYEWSFPMVVAPRYTPDETSESNRIPISASAYAMRAGHDISIELTIDAGVPIEALSSETHETEVERPDDRKALVRLKDQNTIPNKDFILKYQVAGSTINDAVLAHRSERGGFFTLILQPPQRVTAEDVMPKELVFVLDTSGSMSGFPIEKAKETMKLAIDTLYPHDTFNLITFSGDTDILFSEPQPATPENLRKAKKFIDGKHGDGGTEMMKAIVAALKPSDSQHHVRITCFMTDGEVGNDGAIIAEVQKYKNARVFAMGFGSAPNRFLLDNMAKYGRGEVDYVPESGDTSAVAHRFNERIRNPLLTDISIDWSPTLPVTEVYPKIVPDLFSAKPLILSGRYLHGGRGSIVLKGKLAGRDFAREIPVELPDSEAAHDVLATLWARRKIDSLMSEDWSSVNTANMKPELKEEISQLGLKFKLMTQFTSFVAVDEVIYTGSEEARPVNVPLNIPAGAVQGVFSELVAVTDASGGQLIFQTDSSIGTQVTTQQLQNLPLQARTVNCYGFMVPGFVAASAAPTAFSSQVYISTNGQRPNANMFTIDGVSANFGITPGGQNPGPSAAGSTLALTASGDANGIAPLDAIQEITVRTTYTQPEYGRVPGAQVNIITRSGTNDFHGSLFHFFGNDALDANDWFANGRGLKKPPRRLNNYGGTLSGPLDRDSIFFFGSYEGLRLRKPMTGITDVPSLPSRAAAVPEVRPFLNSFPVPTGATRPDAFAEFAATFANATRDDAGSLRVDWLREASSFSGRYSFADSAADERGLGGFSLNTVSHTRSLAQTLTGAYTKTSSNNKVLELRANYSRLRVTGSHTLDDFGGAVNLLEVPDGSFTFDLNGRNSALMTGSKLSNVQRQFNTVGGISIATGTHVFKFGADYRRMSPLIGLHTLEQSVLFAGVGQALTGDAARVGLFNRAESSQSPDFDNVSLYAQDEWRRSSRLTLTYGLRWELNPPPSNDGTPPLAVDQANDPAELKAVASGTRLWQTTYLNFAPRFGFAYNLVGKNDPRLILRGGFGVFYDLGQERAAEAFGDSIPYLSSISAAPAIVFDPQLKLPYSLNWTLTIEQSLGASRSLSASYVGNAGRRLLHTQTLFDQNPDFPFLRLTTNTGRSDYRALQAQFKQNFSRGLTSSVSYTWARSFDNVAYDSARNVLMRTNPALDRGASDFHVRRHLTGFVSYEVPTAFKSGFGHKLSRNWAIDSIFNARSAKPINVVYMFPTSFGFAYLRPDVVGGVPPYVDDPTLAGGSSINPAAFIAPLGLQQGNLARNSLRGYPSYQVDLAVRRRFNFSEFVALQVQADAFNLFNHPNFDDPIARDRVFATTLDGNTFTPNSTFGRSSSLLGQSLAGSSGGFGSFYNSGGARSLRFSVKLIF